MYPIILLLAVAAPAAAPAETDQTIVVTASREPVAREESGSSVSVIDDAAIDALGFPLTSDLLRLVPGVSVATSGPRGTQTQVRIRGAEANHSLLFVDGIRFNDPAAGNEPRFELLTSDALSRIEIVRGPQSALWGSEAVGGVIALDTADPRRARGVSAIGEYGSLDSGRGSAQFSTGSGPIGLSGSAGWVGSDGVDSFGGHGEREGFDHRSASLKSVYAPNESVEIGVVGHWIDAESQYDGYDPMTFRRADTLDSTRNRILATRAWTRISSGGWNGTADLSYLDSSNRNRLAGERLNSSFGRRLGGNVQISRTLGRHVLVAALEHQKEEFRTRDQAQFGGTDQDRSRRMTAAIGEWRAAWTDMLATDIAIRHDSFSRFADATTVRATVTVRPAAGWTVHAAYGQGIAQPTFYDLFGFSPGSFVGNASLKPERVAGWEAGLRWQGERATLGLTGFSNHLRDEIIGTFDLTTFLSSTANADGSSKRQGLEAEIGYRLGPINLGANYTYLKAAERQTAGAALVRELRRPRHSFNLTADGRIGRLDLGASLAYVGKRSDTDFDPYPAVRVTLGDYVLASLDLGWRITEAVQAYARAENLLDADYQDVIGYNTPGRTIYAGLRLRLGH